MITIEPLKNKEKMTLIIFFKVRTACFKSYKDYLKIASNAKCQNVILSIDGKNMIIKTCHSNDNISFICY